MTENRSDSIGPRVGCGAAILRDGKLLLIKRRRHPEAGHWGLIGGKVDRFEAVPDAVLREVREETGLELADLRLLCVVDQIDPAADEHWVSPVYTAGRIVGEPRLVEPEKHAALEWFALDDLPAPLTVTARQAIAALR